MTFFVLCIEQPFSFIETKWFAIVKWYRPISDDYCKMCRWYMSCVIYALLSVGIMEL